MYVQRSILQYFDASAMQSGIVAVVGPRQAGKTTFLRERSKSANAAYVMLDDPDAKAMFDSDIKKFENQYMQSRDITVIDEAQYGKDAGAKLKYLADKGLRVWITSSSQLLLGNDVLSWLVGRVAIVRLYPFSLPEFLSANGQAETTPEIVRRMAFAHMAYGGYPKIVLTQENEMKSAMLRDLYETMVLKDISKTFGISDIRSLEAFSRYLSHSIGNVLVLNTLASDLGISFQAVKKYLDAMEKSYLIYLAQPFHTNKLKELSKQPKAYFIDTGLRNAIANVFPSEPDGRLFENYVLSELMKLGFFPKYWRTKGGAEVDFVVEKDGPIPVEVKLKASVGVVERSLRAFIRAYRPKKAVIVFYDGGPGTAKVDGCEIVYTDALGLKESLEMNI
ncbi:MAG: ATP-binding protein [Candidatus Bilamarchaeaceae archaeon]